MEGADELNQEMGGGFYEDSDQQHQQQPTALTTESFKSLLDSALQPFNTRLQELESTNSVRNTYEDISDPSDESDHSESQESSRNRYENEHLQHNGLPHQNPPFYTLPKNAFVGANHIEVDDLCVTHAGTNPMVEVGYRNGRHVIRVLRDIPSVNLLLQSCRLESEVEKEIVVPNITFLKAPLNSTLQEEFGWNFQPNNSIMIEALSEPLSNYARLVEGEENIPKLNDHLQLKTKDTNVLSFASAAKCTHESLQLNGILAGLSAPVSKDMLKDDFQIGNDLHSLIKSHESSTIALKLLDSLHRITISTKSDPVHMLLKEVNHIKGFVDKATLTSLLPILLSTMKKARDMRIKIRDAATRYIKPTSVQFASRSGKVFVPSVFDPDAMARAEALALPFAGNSLRGIYIKNRLY